MPSMTDHCDDCGPAYLHRRSLSPPPAALALSSLPFILTFLLVAIFVLEKLLPLLSPPKQTKNGREREPFTGIRSRKASTPGDLLPKPTIKRVAAFTFAASVALSTVLAELVFCEISNSLNPAARSLALRITLLALLLLVILVTPAIEIYSAVLGAGFEFFGTSKGRLKLAWLLEFAGLAAWLLAFWWIGQGLLGGYLHDDEDYGSSYTFVEGCLERIGVIGISLMASLAGFAAVSSLWQTFGAKSRPVTDAAIARKQAGIDATNDMIAVKQSRQRALERKLSETPQEGFMTRVMGSIRGNSEQQERKGLIMEISGLEAMRSSLTTSLTALQARRRTQLRATTSVGRFVNLASYFFAFYCLYRIISTGLTFMRRLANSPSSSSFQATDPVTTLLALIAKHWDPTLDVPTWSRQISFLLAAVLLLASFSAVLQTFLLFSRFLPSILANLQLSLPLIVSQVTAVYVISSALLLRSSLPREMGGAISEALGAKLSLGFVDRWFEAWFLGSCVLTVVGIFLGKKVAGNAVDWSDDYDDNEDMEMGKRS